MLVIYFLVLVVTTDPVLTITPLGKFATAIECQAALEKVPTEYTTGVGCMGIATDQNGMSRS